MMGSGYRMWVQKMPPWPENDPSGLATNKQANKLINQQKPHSLENTVELCHSLLSWGSSEGTGSCLTPKSKRATVMRLKTHEA